MSEKMFTITKYRCPYCQDVRISVRKAEDLRACSNCLVKFLGKKPIILKEIQI